MCHEAAGPAGLPPTEQYGDQGWEFSGNCHEMLISCPPAKGSTRLDTATTGTMHCASMAAVGPSRHATTRSIICAREGALTKAIGRVRGLTLLVPAMGALLLVETSAAQDAPPPPPR